jgi:hypothetical protein
MSKSTDIIYRQVSTHKAKSLFSAKSEYQTIRWTFWYQGDVATTEFIFTTKKGAVAFIEDAIANGATIIDGILVKP